MWFKKSKTKHKHFWRLHWRSYGDEADWDYLIFQCDKPGCKMFIKYYRWQLAKMFRGFNLEEKEQI